MFVCFHTLPGPGSNTPLSPAHWHIQLCSHSLIHQTGPGLLLVFVLFLPVLTGGLIFNKFGYNFSFSCIILTHCLSLYQCKGGNIVSVKVHGAKCLPCDNKGASAAFLWAGSVECGTELFLSLQAARGGRFHTCLCCIYASIVSYLRVSGYVSGSSLLTCTQRN